MATVVSSDPRTVLGEAVAAAERLTPPPAADGRSEVESAPPAGGLARRLDARFWHRRSRLL